MKHISSSYPRLFIAFISLVFFLGLVASLISPALPAHAELPPRPESSPTPPTEPSNDSTIGAQIRLEVAGAVGNEWTVVEWQDPNTSDWHTVEGWQGTLEATGIQVWWVGKTEFGQSPFRWLLYDEKGGTLLDMSAEFTLPTRNKQIVVVSIPHVEE